ncbi:MAG: hypothetical protein RIB97_13175 [Nitratireductor sp.]
MSHAPIRQDLFAGLVNEPVSAGRSPAEKETDHAQKQRGPDPELPIRDPVPANDNRPSFAGEVAGFTSLSLEVARLLTGISSAGHKGGKDGD